jgi:hypothetical protein
MQSKFEVRDEQRAAAAGVLLGASRRVDNAGGLI